MEKDIQQYICLYMGISNLEEISKKIFMETTQLMDKNLRRFMNSKDKKQYQNMQKQVLIWQTFLELLKTEIN